MKKTLFEELAELDKALKEFAEVALKITRKRILIFCVVWLTLVLVAALSSCTVQKPTKFKNACGVKMVG